MNKFVKQLLVITGIVYILVLPVIGILISRLRNCADRNFKNVGLNTSYEDIPCTPPICPMQDNIVCSSLDTNCLWYNNSYEKCINSCDCGWCSISVTIYDQNTSLVTQCLPALYFNQNHSSSYCKGDWIGSNHKTMESSCKKERRRLFFKAGYLYATYFYIGIVLVATIYYILYLWVKKRNQYYAV